MKNSFKINALNAYLLIVIIGSYCLAGAYYLIFPEKDPTSFTIMAVLYMYMPFLSALLVDKFLYKRSSLKSWAINFRPNWWYLAAWPAVIIVAYLVLAVNLLWPDISFSSEMTGFWQRMAEQMTPEQVEFQKAKLDSLPVPYIYLMIGQTLIAGLSINAMAAFGEETGWRGFMVREYKHLKFWDAALRIGIVWGIWHAPLILMGHNYPQHNYLGVGMMVVWCILLSPLFLFIRMKTHSTIGTSILHGTLNASAGIPLMFLVGGNDLNLGVTGFAGFIVLALVIAIMVVYDLKVAKQSITNRTLIEGISN
ncbi:MAG: CPBP family intramembrane glutamic endopeptidase [Prolixibacteraceae bacterium]